MNRELLLERLERLAIALDEFMPRCAELVRDAIALLKEQDGMILALGQSNAANEYLNAEVERLTGLLKEQEAVVPIPPKDESDLWRCGNCNHQLFRCTHQRYCEMCGQEVKWNA